MILKSRFSSIAVSLMMLGILFSIPGGQGSLFEMTPDPFNNATVHVNLTHENGTPAIGMTVSLRSVEGGHEFESTTNATGQATLSVFHHGWGPALIKARNGSGPSIALKRVYIEPIGHHFFDINVSEPPAPEVTIGGVVSDHDTDGVIEGIMMDIRFRDRFDNLVIETDTTGMDGSYEVTVPRSGTDYSVRAYNSPSYQGAWRDVYVDETSTEIEVDIELEAKDFPTRTLDMNVYNRSTGFIIPGDSLFISGYNSEREHLHFSDYYSHPNATGWWNTEVPAGEYDIRWYSYDVMENLTFRAERSVYVNDSDLELGIPFEIPEMDLLTVRVVNDSGPLSSAQITWSHWFSNDNGQFEIEGRAYTNSSGYADLNIIENTTTTIRADKSGHQWKTVDFHPPGDSHTHNLEITMEEISSPAYETAMTTVTFVDEITGSPIPQAYLTFDGRIGKDHFTIGKDTNETGVFQGEIPVAIYDRISANHNLGKGILEDVSISSEGPNEFTVMLTDRNQHLPERVQVRFDVVDTDGDPLAGEFINLRKQGDYSESIDIMSDSNGTVTALLLPGTYKRDTVEHSLYYRQPFIGSDMVEVTSEGGELQEMKLYPQLPLEPITGHVKDSVTGEVLIGAYVDANSYYILDEKHLGPYPPDSPDEGVFVDDISVNTDTTGYYRTYGVNTVYLEIEKDGYFPETRSFEMVETRSPRNFEIELDPIPDYSVFLNFTVSDQYGDSIPSFAYVIDADYPMMEPLYDDERLDGNFSFFLYPGTFDIHFGNGTLQDKVTVTVDENGIDDLELILRPSTYLMGTVTTWNGTPLDGANVTLEKVIEGNNNTFQYTETDMNGTFMFHIIMGDYQIHIQGTDLYLPKTVNSLTTEGWTPINLTVVIENRTTGMVHGKVLGSAGPFDMGIPDSSVMIMNSTGSVLHEMETDHDGSFSFSEIPMGDYVIMAEPSPIFRYNDLSNSGYSTSEMVNISVEGISTEVDLTLPYSIYDDETFLEVLGKSPEGGNISLDEPIFIVFSEKMNITLVESGISVTPALTDMEYVWFHEENALKITHGGLSPNTTYTVNIDGGIMSDNGYRFENWTGIQWNFTTGTSATSFSLYISEVEVDSGGNLSAVVWGKVNQTVFLVIGELGSFQMIEENGRYQVTIGTEEMEYDREYYYHFSDSEGGPDIAPDLSGTFSTVEEPVIGDDDDTGDDDDDDDTGGDTSDDADDEGLSAGQIIGIIAGALAVIVVLVIIMVVLTRSSGEKEDSEEEDEEFFDDEDDDFDEDDGEEDEEFFDDEDYNFDEDDEEEDEEFFDDEDDDFDEDDEFDGDDDEDYFDEEEEDEPYDEDEEDYEE